MKFHHNTLASAMLLVATNVISQQSPKFEIESKLNARIESWIEEIDEEKTFSRKTMNYYFSNVLNSYIASPETPSLKEFTAVLKTDESTFEFGYTKDVRDGDNTKYINDLVYVGFKTIGTKKNSFFSLTDTKTNPINFGLDLRFTKITQWRGMTTKHKSQEKAKKFRGEDKLGLTNYIEESNLGRKVKKALEDKSVEELEEKVIDNAIGSAMNEYIDSQELDYISYLGWVNFGAFIPINKIDYTYINNQDSYVKDNELEQSFRNWNFFASANIYSKWGWANGTLSLSTSHFKNNTILIEELAKKTFTNVVDNPDNLSLPLDTKEIFAGEYKEFWTTQIKTEIVTLLYKNAVGVSGAVEWNLGGNYGKRNWKLGIPINLKDKDGKSTINFELQWREINANHLVGIRVGKSFGAYVK